MKDGIHPKYFPNAKVTCACGHTWETGATQEEIRTDVCSNCHPFYTGKMQRILDTAGTVERFNKRVEQAQALRAAAEQRAKDRAERARARQLVEIVDEDEAVEPIEAASSDEAE